MKALHAVRRGVRPRCWAALAIVLHLSVRTHAQTATAPELKAAFLYNFAKFVEWPANSMAAGTPLVVCVLGDGAVADALESMTDGKAIDGHALATRRVKVDSPLRTCHVLYISGLDAKGSHQLLEGLGDSAVFTASDLDRFAQLGGVANFFVENGKMRFAVNIESAQRARLQVSSKLLGLAKIVKDEQHVQR
jgi:YfiR/HmsC-like